MGYLTSASDGSDGDTGPALSWRSVRIHVVGACTQPLRQSWMGHRDPNTALLVGPGTFDPLSWWTVPTSIWTYELTGHGCNHAQFPFCLDSLGFFILAVHWVIWLMAAWFDRGLIQVLVSHDRGYDLVLTQSSIVSILIADLRMNRRWQSHTAYVGSTDCPDAVHGAGLWSFRAKSHW